MALLQTPQKNETFTAPDFTLMDVSEKMLSFDDIKGKNGAVIAFICNHCPYVHAIIDRLVEDAKTLQANGKGFAAIMPNDTINYPQDNFENMQKFASKHGFTFPYLIDETQKIAKAYDAICTPDIFGLNAQSQLQYRGRLDSAGANQPDQNTVRELVTAMLEIAGTGQTKAEQFSSMGCSIKWK